MNVTTKNNKQVVLRKLVTTDYDDLITYFDGLSAETKKRFSPHSFDKNNISNFYLDEKNIGFIGQFIETSEIVAYSIIKTGYLEHDGYRFQSYGMPLNKKTDGTFAPSVADAWQSFGIGNALFEFILSELRHLNIKTLVLWGGVQAENAKAINFYKKNGFQTFGKFYHNGENYDMALVIR